MKYIRTKDGHIVDTSIYKKVVERTGNNGEVVAIDLNHWGQDYDKEITWIEVKDILKQADTIEELCDEFVIIPLDQNKKPITRFIRHLNEPINPFANDSHIIYGAIWVKGIKDEPILKSVAELNEKGELELL